MKSRRSTSPDVITEEIENPFEDLMEVRTSIDFDNNSESGSSLYDYNNETSGNNSEVA